MPCSDYGFHESPVAPVPNQGKPETTPAAEAATEQKAPGSEFTRETPRAVKDILDELNRVRLELSALYVERYNYGPTLPGGTYTPYPPVSVEDIERNRRMDELERLEEALDTEFRAAKHFLAGDSRGGQPYQGDAIVIGQDRGL